MPLHDALWQLLQGENPSGLWEMPEGISKARRDECVGEHSSPAGCTICHVKLALKASFLFSL